MTYMHNTNLIKVTISDKIHNYCILELDVWYKSQHSDKIMSQIGQKLTELWEFEDVKLPMTKLHNTNLVQTTI